MGKLAPER